MDLRSREELARLIRVFLTQLQKHSFSHESTKHKEATQLFAQLTATHPSIKDESMLTKLLKSDVGTMEHNFIYLNPIKGQELIMPFLTVEFNFTKELHLRAYLAMAKFGRDSSVESWAFRFETAEGAGERDKGIHDYEHAQPTFQFGGNASARREIQGCHPPVSTSLPAFPLNAEDPLELLAALILSLYGAEQLRRYCESPGGSSAGLSDRVGSYIERLIPQRNYYKLSSKTGTRHVVTRVPDKEFRSSVKGFTISTADAASFNKANASDTDHFFRPKTRTKQ